jgi:hypothetical protein
MTILYINTGTSANAGNGDSLRTAFNKINANFTYLSTASFGGGGSGGGGGGNADLGDIVITSATISTSHQNESIIFDPNGTGVVRFRNTPIQFDNGTGGNLGPGAQIIQTKGSGSRVGIGMDANNSSIRIVGDKDTFGTLVDFGLYDGAFGVWQSKFYIDYLGNVTSRNIHVTGGITSDGLITASSGIRFGDGTTLNQGTTPLSVSYYTSGTAHGIVPNVTSLQFDSEAGFTVDPLNTGTVLISMNSTFKYWEVDGQPTLIAEGLDYMHFIAGHGIEITTDPLAQPHKSITFSLSGSGSNLGDLTVDGINLYPVSQIEPLILSNKNYNSSTVSASYIYMPRTNDAVTPFQISSPNEVRITTEVGSDATITIAPNVDGFGPGKVVVASSSATNSAGVYLSSYSAQINLWPNKTIGATNYADANVGSLDLLTLHDENISIRPGGTGTVIVTAPLSARQGIILGTEFVGAGGGLANSSTYQILASPLTITAPVHKLSTGDYWLPAGTEGQVVHFVPKTGTLSGTDVRVWFNNLRTISSGVAAEYQNQFWYPFNTISTATDGLVYAIYTDNAWTTNHGQAGGDGGGAGRLVLDHMSIRNSNVTLDGLGNSGVWPGTVQNAVNTAGFANTNANNTLITFAAAGAASISLQADGSLFLGDGLGTNPFNLDASTPGWVVAQNGLATSADIIFNGYIRSGLADGQLALTTNGFIVQVPPIAGGTAHQWTFSESGGLVFPDTSIQQTAWIGSVNSLINGAYTLGLNSNGIVVFPISDNGSATLQTIADLNLQANDKIWKFGTNGNILFPDSTVQQTAWDPTAPNIGFTGDVSFTGNVTFSGTSTYVYSTNTVYTDNLIELHVPPFGVDGTWATDDGKDIGLRIHYYNRNSTSTANAAIILANNTQEFEFYIDGAGQANDSIVSGGTYAPVRLGKITIQDNGGNDFGIRFPDGTLQQTAFSSGKVSAAAQADFASTAGYALSFDTSTLVTLAVTALTANTSSWASTATYAQTFNTSTLVNRAVNANVALLANYASSFNTSTLVTSAVSAYTLINTATTLVGYSVTATFAQSFNTATLVANSVNAQLAAKAVTANLATTATFAQSFNTATLVATSVNIANTAGTYVGLSTTATFAQSFNTATLVSTAVSALTFNTATLVANSVNAQVADNALTASLATTATNLAGGALGSIPIQSDLGVTSFLSVGGAGYILQSDGVTVQWVSTSSLGLSGGIAFNTATLVARAVTATFAESFNTATLVALAVTAQITQTSTWATTATYAQSFNTATLVHNAVDAGTATYAIAATYAVSAYNAFTSTWATTATYTLAFNTSTLIKQATTSSWATSASYAMSFNTATLVTTAVNAGTATYALVSTTATYAQSFNTATLVNIAVNAGTATYAIAATTATYALAFNTATLVANAVTAYTATWATTATYALAFNTATLVSLAVTSTYAQSFNTATLVSLAVTSTYAQSFNTATLVTTAVTALGANTSTWATTSTYTLAFNTATLVNLTISAGNLTGGVNGSLPYQSAAGATTMLPIGLGGQILTVSGGVPQWTNVSGLSAGQASTASNLAGGVTGSIPYQTQGGGTGFINTASTGTILTSNGAAAPSYQTTQSIYVGLSTTATFAQSFTTGTLVTSAVNAYTATWATTATYALAFNTATLMANAVNAGTATYALVSTTATYAQSFNTATLVTTSTYALAFNTATLVTTSTYALAFNTSTLINRSVLAGTATYALVSTTATYAQSFNTATLIASAVTAQNIVGGSTGSLIIQTAAGISTTLPIGSEGYLLKSDGTTAAWVSTSSVFSFNTATLVSYANTSMYAMSFNTGTLVNSSVNAGTATYAIAATTATYALAFNTSTLVADAVNATYAISAQTAVTATNASNVTITNDASSASAQYITFSPANSGFNGLKTSSASLTYTPSTGVISTPGVYITSTASSTSTLASNALAVAGGAYINSLFVKDSTTFSGQVTFNGPATYVYSTNTVYTDNMIEMHTPPGGVGNSWTQDDGKDIGFRFHYYTNSTDTNAALILDNTTKELHWYNSGAEATNGDFSSSTFGTFRTGNVVLVSGTASGSTASGSLIVQGGVGIWQNLNIGGNLNVSGNLNAQIITGVSTTATNINNGTLGQIPYQTGPGATSFFGPGSAGQVLLSNGAAVPVYTNTSSIYVNAATYATTILNGTAGQLLYQSGANTTAFVGAGTAGQILLSGGTSSPSFTSTASIVVGSATTAGTANNIAVGTQGQLVFQSGPGATAFAGPGTAGQLLMSAGTTSTGPVYTNTSSIYVNAASNAVNLTRGVAGQLVYQSDVGTTAFYGPGTAGQILLSNGLNGPQYTSTASIYVNAATYSKNILGGLAGQLHYQSSVDTTALLSTGTTGQVLTMSAGLPVWGTNSISLNGTSGAGSVTLGGTITYNSTNGVTIVASGATLTISTPQDVQKTDAPTFAGLTVNGTISANSFSGTGTNLTSLTAGNLTGTIPSGVLGNSTLYIGTTGLALNRASATGLTLNGVSIDGNAGTVSNGVYTTGSYADPSWITSLAGSKVTGSIGGISSGTSAALTVNNGGSGDTSGFSFNGSVAKTISYNSIGASPLAGSSSLVTVGTVTAGTWTASTIASNYGGTGVNNGGRTLTITGANRTLDQDVYSGASPTFAGTNFTSLPAGQLGGTIPSGVLGNSSLYLGTTSIPLNRASGAVALTGITSIDGDAATVGGLAISSARNNVANKVVRTDANGYIQAGYINSSDGNENNNSNPDRVWGSNSTDSYLRSYRTSALNVAYASSAGSVSGNVSGASTIAMAIDGAITWPNDEHGGSGDTFKIDTYAVTGEDVRIRIAVTNDANDKIELNASGGVIVPTGTIQGTATSAYYADLAEKYLADAEYEPGTVLVFGGESEVTISSISHDYSVAGVVSTKPGFMMNSELENGTYIALQGRVPCRVVGKIKKGDLMVTSDIAGVAQAMDKTKYQPGCVIGKALENYDSAEVGEIEVVVGRV